MSSTRNPGRVAGLLYLLLLAGPLRLLYIPSKLFVHGNATATVPHALLLSPQRRVSMCLQNEARLFSGGITLRRSVLPSLRRASTAGHCDRSAPCTLDSISR